MGDLGEHARRFERTGSNWKTMTSGDGLAGLRLRFGRTPGEPRQASL
jgi:hypothetical protein